MNAIKEVSAKKHFQVIIRRESELKDLCQDKHWAEALEGEALGVTHLSGGRDKPLNGN